MATNELDKMVNPLHVIVSTLDAYQPKDTKLVGLSCTMWDVVFDTVRRLLWFELNCYTTPGENLAAVQRLPAAYTQGESLSTRPVAVRWIEMLQPPELELAKQICLRLGDYLRWVKNDQKHKDFVLLKICETSVRGAYHQARGAWWGAREWAFLQKEAHSRLGKFPVVYVYLKDPGPIENEEELAMMEDLRTMEEPANLDVMFGGIITQEQWETEWDVAKGGKAEA